MKEIIHEMYSEEVVAKRVQEIAEQINKDLNGEPLHLICILKGSMFFCADLARHLDMPVSIDFMAASSYGDNTVSSGMLEVTVDLADELDGKNCLIVEDIIDTGNTIDKVEQLLKARSPKSLRVCALLDKPDRRETPVTMDYVGFTIPDTFVVGYGLDYAQRYRNLRFIGNLEFVEE